MKTLQKNIMVLAATLWLAPLTITNVAQARPAAQRDGGFNAGGKPAPTPTPRPKPVGPPRSGDE